VPEQPYKRPPITEAIIEARFADEMEPAQLERIIAGFASSYPHQQPIRNVGVALAVPPEVSAQPVAQFNQQVGYRRSSTDLTELLLVWPAIFVVSQLAPYPGWDTFFARLVRDWTNWKRLVGYRRVVRIGVRYINRIDIPTPSASGIIEETEYLNIFPKLPDGLGPMTAFGVQAVVPLGDIGCNLTINSGAVPSPLLNHCSFMLDTDIAKEGSVPQKDDEIFALLEQVRVKKNAIFEACVTDRARELFQK
jgi:uncharacterized protein (TIGR04255 family)